MYAEACAGPLWSNVSFRFASALTCPGGARERQRLSQKSLCQERMSRAAEICVFHASFSCSRVAQRLQMKVQQQVRDECCVW